MALYVDITKKLGNFTLDVKIATESKSTALFGMSGSGKSVTLKCIAGILKPDSGVIILNDRILFDSEKKINIPSQERNIGYLPQNFALFPDMNVSENIICGLHKHNRKERKSLCIDLLKRFNLAEISHLYPHQLSGGQQQRVALVRALATKPELLLFDEPFSSLDSLLKQQLELDMLFMLKQFDGEILFVSHDKDEVCRICDSVCVIENGTNTNVKSLNSVLDCPETISEALLSGFDNIGRIADSSLSEFGFMVDAEKSADAKFIAVKSESIKIDNIDCSIVFEAVIVDIIRDSNKHYLICKANDKSKHLLVHTNYLNQCINKKTTLGIDNNDVYYLK